VSANRLLRLMSAPLFGERRLFGKRFARFGLHPNHRPHRRVHAPVGFFLAVVISWVLGIGLVCHTGLYKLVSFPKPAAH
jgi:hypothetical protein